MRRFMLRSVAALLASTGLAVAQTPATPAKGEAKKPSSVRRVSHESKAKDAADDGIVLTGHGAVEIDEANAWSMPGDVKPAVPDGPAAEEPCGPCTSPGRFFLDAEYLLWALKDAPLPVPLVTTGTTTSAGVLGRPGTQTVYGGQAIGYDLESGGRLRAGWWFDKGQHLGMEASGFFLGDSDGGTRLQTTPTGTPLLTRPVVNALNGLEAANPVAVPNLMGGGVDVHSVASLYGMEANLLGSLFRSDWCSADMLFGFGYYGLSEDLTITTRSSPIVLGGGAAFNGRSVGAPNSVSVMDRFEARNDFYGGQLGVRTEFIRHCIILGLEAKLAVGNIHQSIGTIGQTQLRGGSGGILGTSSGGLLALGTNSGLQTRDQFGYIPQGAVKLGYRFTDHISLFASYSFLYWFDVVRPGDQIDRTVNPRQVPSNLQFGLPGGPPQPVSQFNHSDLWAQGLGLGFEIRY